MKNDASTADKRALKTRRRLQDALTELLEIKPYAAIKIMDIADRAEVSRQTLYLHYYNKNDLLVATLDRYFLQYRDLLIGEIDKDDLDHHMLCQQIFTFWENNRRALELLFAADISEMLFTRHRAIISEIIGRHCEAQNKTISDKAAYIVDFVTAGSIEMLKRWLRDDEPISSSAMADIVSIVTLTLEQQALDMTTTENKPKLSSISK
ncbi:hypothetical protein R50073_31050 [Maricurvus nonylphenolicus]|uniref:TetR/AcrR family transcriptional regulator n=1 Tax=Maricurvus nonylphenolicus TaxID=1008307 RepID=UPI0036F3F7F4